MDPAILSSGNGMLYRSAEVMPRDSRDGSPGPGMTSWTSAARAVQRPAETACREAMAKRNADAYRVMVQLAVCKILGAGESWSELER